MKATTIKRTRIPTGLAIAAAMLALLLSLSPALDAPVAAQTVAVIRPEPATLELAVGETATVEIRLENARDVYGIDVRGAFDPTILEVVDADASREGTQMRSGAFPQPDFVALNAADNAAGAFRYVVTQVNPTPPATGSGVVFSFQVRGRAGGTTDLAITLVEMADRDGNLLTVTTGSAVVQVTGPTAAPTGIILQPTGAPPGGDDAATATLASGANPTVAPPGATATAAQAAGVTAIAATATAPGETVAIPPPGATLSAPAPPSAGDTAATALPATDPTSEAAAATGEAGPAEEPAAGIDSGEPGGASPLDESAGAVAVASAVAPAVIGGESAPAGGSGAVAPADSGAVDGFPVAIIIGGVALLGLAGFLLLRTRRRE